MSSSGSVTRRGGRCREFGYDRVSTSVQDLATQPEQLRAAGCERVFHDKPSALDRHQPPLRKLLPLAALGDTIYSAINRLSRDIADVLTIARELKAAGVGLRSSAEPIIDTTGELSELVLGIAAKSEHRCIGERTAIDHAAAKAAGERLGRAPSLAARAERR